jgi:hypothetical protein
MAKIYPYKLIDKNIQKLTNAEVNIIGKILYKKSNIFKKSSQL